MTRGRMPIAMLVRSPLASVLARATAYVSVPVFILIGIIFPLILIFIFRNNATE